MHMIKKFILLLGLLQVGCVEKHVVVDPTPQIPTPPLHKLTPPPLTRPEPRPPTDILRPAPPEGKPVKCQDPPECKVFY